MATETQARGKGAAEADAKIAEAISAEAQVEADKQAEVELRNEFFAEMAAFGKRAAEGKTAIVDAARKFGNACAGNTMINADDAEVAYRNYVMGFDANKGRGFDPHNPSSKASKASVSIFKSFGLKHVAAFGDTLWDQVLSVRETIPASDRKQNSAYNALVPVNRAFNKLAESIGFAMARKQVTDEWIAEILSTGPAKPSKSDVEKLTAALKALTKAAGAETFSASLLPVLVAKLEADIAALITKGVAAPATELIKWSGGTKPEGEAEGGTKH